MVRVVLDIEEMSKDLLEFKKILTTKPGAFTFLYLQRFMMITSEISYVKKNNLKAADNPDREKGDNVNSDRQARLKHHLNELSDTITEIDSLLRTKFGKITDKKTRRALIARWGF